MTIEAKASALGLRPISRRWTNVATTVGLIVYTIVFSELFIRLLAPQPIFPRYVTGTPWGVRGNIPGAHYWHTSADMKVEFRINRWGMRDDRDFTLEKPPGVCRIAVFGDSFLMGYEVDLKNSFSSRLEARIRASGLNVQVLNFAVSGFGTAEMLRTYEAFGRNFAPDVVIFGWNSSDLADNVRADLYQLKNGRLVPGSPTYLPSTEVQNFLMESRVYLWIANHSHLYSLLRERIGLATKRLLARANRFRFRLSSTATASNPDERNEQTNQYSAALAAALLQKSRQEAERGGSDFVLVDIPDSVSRTSFKSSFDLVSRNLRDLKTILPLDAFRAAARPDRSLYYEHGEGHLTPKAVDILARLTAEAIWKSPKFAGCRAQGTSSNQGTMVDSRE